MKRFTRMLAAVLCIAMLLSVSAFADAKAGRGLKVFENVDTMTSYTYSDVEVSLWSYSAIRTAYEKGIIIGFPDGTFQPNMEVSWAQAMTIAARLHAAYYGNLLDTAVRSGDYWYSPYERYCAARNLLPSNRPVNGDLDTVSIIRYDLAYMFSRCLDDEDMPVISQRQITDLDQIPAMYLESVQKVYASGIMNGSDDYVFCGNDFTTREQIAAVVSRLLEPANRIGYDPKVNADMAAFEANLENDSIAVQIGAYTYCVYKYQDTATQELYALYRTVGNDHSDKLYVCKGGEVLGDLSVYHGKLYFSVNMAGSCYGKLMCYDPASGSFSVVYNGYSISSYCFYDGIAYALLFTNYGNGKIADWRFDFGKLEGGKFTPLLSTMDYYQSMYFVPYGWNGCIYFKYYNADTDSTNLYEYSIANKTLEKLSDVNINTSFFDGHVMYFMAFDSEKQYDLNLYALSVQAPAVIRTIGEFPSTMDKPTRSLYKNGNTFYLLSGFNRNVYSMTEDGDVRLALNCLGVYNAMCFTQDNVILIPTTVTTSNVNEMKIYAAKSLASRELLGDWMGLSCYYKGARFVPEKGQPVYSSGEESVSTVSDISIVVPEAFMKGSDLVVRAKYTNNINPDIATNAESIIKLRMYLIRVFQGDELVAYDLNKMLSMEMEPHDVQTFTFILGAEDITGDIDVGAGDFTIEIVPTYDVEIIEAIK